MQLNRIIFLSSPGLATYQFVDVIKKNYVIICLASSIKTISSCALGLLLDGTSVISTQVMLASFPGWEWEWAEDHTMEL